MKSEKKNLWKKFEKCQCVKLKLNSFKLRLIYVFFIFNFEHYILSFMERVVDRLPLMTYGSSLEA